MSNKLYAPLKAFLFLLIGVLPVGTLVYGQNFDIDTLQNVSVSSSTALEWGPDGRLYVLEVLGDIKILTINRTDGQGDGNGDFFVTNSETLTFVKTIPNHDDDGTANAGVITRQATGITVGGTAANPVIYVASSDVRKGGPSGDKNLDTNSGVITRLTFTGSGWEVVDIVRGLPRSEENHATNGLDLIDIQGKPYLTVCSGGNTNGGAPSTKFAWITEFALASALLAVDLDQINALPIKTDNNSGRQYIYDLPTVDDPTRANVNGIIDPDSTGYNGIDINDPWGGNDGLNQTKLVVDGPVQMLSPGYRNTYDHVVTESGAIFVTDNGPNGGWGGLPINEGTPNVLNDYPPSEIGDGSDNKAPDGEFILNNDHLHKVTDDIQTYVFGSYYAGHPVPIRANPASAGLYTRGLHSPDHDNDPATENEWFRTKKYDPDSSDPEAADPMKALPADWPPVPIEAANPVESDWRSPGKSNPDGPDDGNFTEWANNTNGIDEYTASSFDGLLKGDLIAGRSGGFLTIVHVSETGTLDSLSQDKFSVQGGNPLGIDCVGDDGVFPGSIWVGTFDSRIMILDPVENIVCIAPGEPEYDPLADYDLDGYTNQDEEDNGTDPCSGASVPGDVDGDQISDLNDLDDDNDGILDENDPFQFANVLEVFELPMINELFSDQEAFGGYLGLGFTGMMNNGDPNPNYLDWQDDRFASDTDLDDILGGAIGAITMFMTEGDARQNTQEKGYQFGVNVSTATGPFEIQGRMIEPFDGNELDQTQGIYFGTGDQDNYVKVVLTNSGLQLSGEDNGVFFENAFVPITIPTISLDIFFEIDPVANTVQAKYSLDSGEKQLLGTPFALSGATLTAVQSAATPLAVGVIGSNAGFAEFGASWDFFRVYNTLPFLVQPLNDLQVNTGSDDDILNLNEFFNDDQGTDNLTYSITGNTDPTVGTIITGNLLDISYPNTPASTTITIRATDAEGNFIEDSFDVTVVEQPVVVYRINAGGEIVLASDSPNPNWAKDTDTAPFQYVNSTEVNKTASASPSGFINSTIYPTDLFLTERFTNLVGTPLAYALPLEDGVYTINLLFAETFINVDQPNERVFDVEIEGQVVLDNYDTYVASGNGQNVAIVEQFEIVVIDGILNIEFFKQSGKQNPIIKGIEVLLKRSIDPPSAEVAVHPGINNIDASTFGANAFQVTNTSTEDQNIASVTFDLSTNFLPEMLFDPDGTAGDLTAKPFTINGTDVTGVLQHNLSQPVGNGGFLQLDILFDDFQPGEKLEFAIDVDPSSIEGIPSPGPNENGSVSGLEMVGTGITVTFDDGTSYSSSLYSDGSNAGSVATLNDKVLNAPLLSIQGLSSPAIVNSFEHVLVINNGRPNGVVSLLQVEAGFFQDTLNLVQDPFEVNSAVNVVRTTDIILNSNGQATVPVTLLATDPEAGYNYFVLAPQNGTFFGRTSNVVIMQYDENSGPAALEGFTNLGAECANKAVNVAFYNPSTNAKILEQEVVLDNSGNFLVPDVPSGNYNIFVAVEGHLRTVLTSQTLVTGTNILNFGDVKPGDLDANNLIDASDYSTLFNRFGKADGEVEYDFNLDFNCDGVINELDFELLKNNFGQMGVKLPDSN